MRRVLFPLVSLAAPLFLLPLSAHADTLDTFSLNFNSFSSYAGGTGTVTATDDGLGDYTVTSFSYNVDGFSNSYDANQLSGSDPTASIGTFGPFYSFAFSSLEDVLNVYSGDGEGYNLFANGGDINDGGGVGITLESSTPLSATPEPSSLALLGTALLGATGLARRRFLRS